MDYNRSIVVISEGDDHSKLTTQLEPIRLSQNRGLAVKSIFHGPMFNIDKSKYRTFLNELLRVILINLMKNISKFLKGTIQRHYR